MRVFLLLIWIIIGSYKSVSQNQRAHIINDVIHPEFVTKRLLENKKRIRNLGIPLKSPDPVYIPLKFHLVAQSDGSGKIDVSQVLNELCEVNIQFSEIGMIFYIKDGFNDLDHTPSYEVPRSGTAVSRMISEKDENAVNIFLTQNADQSNIDNGTSLGYFNGSADFIVVRKSQIGSSASTLAHEIGHYFSLRHPHYGWEDDPWTQEQYGKKVTVTMVSSSQTGFQNVRVELVDQSNCENSADLLCDTPPDYNFGLLWPNDCPPFNLDVMDRNGDTVRPMSNNFMSYFIGCDPYQFTTMQGQVMLADYSSDSREEIRSDYIPQTEDLTGDLILVNPPFNETVNILDPVSLEWDFPATSSVQYYVVVKSGNQEIRIYTDKTQATIQDLEADRTYTWSVLPFNEIGGCGERETGIFKTTDMSTAVIDPDIVKEVNLYPNPLIGNSEMTLQFYSEKTSQSVLRIFDTTGQLMASGNYEVVQGENKLEYLVANMKTGLYFITLSIEGHLLTRSFLKI